jgi:uncharacterized protein
LNSNSCCANFLVFFKEKTMQTIDNGSLDLACADLDCNPSTNPTFTEVIATRLSRRGFLNGGLKLSAAGALSASGLAACGSSDDPVAASPEVATPPVVITPPTPKSLSFTPVSKGLADQVVVAPGYNVTVVTRLGDPLNATTPEFKNDGTDSGDSYANRIGDHADGMHYFGLDSDGKKSNTSSTRALLATNHEALTPVFLHPAGVTILGTGVASKRTVAEEVAREMNAMGVSVTEVNQTAGKWSYKKDSAFNRRFTTNTPMQLSGPAAGSTFMRTKFSPDGTQTRGTANNCASGYTPWGTYITCEENWAGYFRRIETTDNPKRSAKEIIALNRYGVRGNGRELWATVTPDTADNLYGRWLAEKTGSSNDGVDDFRNVSNTFGWNVEIDPYNPTSTAKKRTAMGRFAHEGAWPAKAEAGKPLAWYMGCDSRNEYIYKYVSAKNWDPIDANGGLPAGDKYLDDGKLFVAKFNADGTGNWVELKFGSNGITPAATNFAFENQADVLVNARLAADVVGATKMDRPEWGGVNPLNGDIYITLTNTNAASRPIDKVDAANPRFYNDKRTTGADQKGNVNGHIIRFAETNNDVMATSFKWDIFLFGSRATQSKSNINLSGLTDANDFSSPDGLWFSKAIPGMMWIQTDDGAYTDVTNCMLLACLPGSVGDGAKVSVNNVDATATKSVDTYVGAELGEAKLKRFLVGPKDCEITGIAEAPDGKSLFINIQHPGEDTQLVDFTAGSFTSYWPDGSPANKRRPRSATIVITKADGGLIGV